MHNFNSYANNTKPSFFGNAPLGFKIMGAFVALIFAATLAFIIFFYVSAASNGGRISYEYNYKVGNVEHSESYNYDN